MLPSFCYLLAGIKERFGFIGRRIASIVTTHRNVIFCTQRARGDSREATLPQLPADKMEAPAVPPRIQYLSANGEEIAVNSYQGAFATDTDAPLR